MKPITALLLFSLTAVGTACSDTVETASAEEPTTVETAGTDSEVKGSLNLNIGRTAEPQGGLIVGSNAGNSSGLIVGSAGTGGNIDDVEGLGIEIVGDPDSLLDNQPKSDEDEIVRLPE